MASSSPDWRLWRTAFLNLRDEALTSPPPSSLLILFRRLFFSQIHDALAVAAASLPISEVTADVTLLVELASATTRCEDAVEPLLQIIHLIHNVCCRVQLEFNSFSWTLIMNFLKLTMETVLGSANPKNYLTSTLRLKMMAEISETLRLIIKVYGRNCLISETSDLAMLLIFIISNLHSEMLSLQDGNDDWHATDNGSAKPKYSSLYEIQIMVLSLLRDAVSKLGTSISGSLWEAVVTVLRKLMDFVASKNVIVDSIMSRFYAALFHCLHLILSDPKGSLSAHVAGFVTTLQLFFTYGLSSRSLAFTAVESENIGINSSNEKSEILESWKSKRVPYKPPHLRRRGANALSVSAESSYNCESSSLSLFSSDSEQSDNDASPLDGDRYHSSKARLAAIFCIQDLCIAEPKSITSLWTLLLPESDVLQPRKHRQTLMSCLLFDPIMKIRFASSSTLASMLDGHSVVFLQLAEHRESTKCGSFTALSSSLGQILMQLHTGVLYLIKSESHEGLLVSLFKVLILLISATPYARMPDYLFSNTVSSVHDKIKRTLAFKMDNVGLQATAVSCLGAALSKSPPSAHALKMLEEGAISQNGMSVPFLLIELSELGRHPAITFEALQVLKAISHNYPSIMSGFWEQISAIAYRFLHTPVTPDFSGCNGGSWMGDHGKASGPISERCTVAAIKVIDECLRAVSGFKGADDLLEFRFLDIQLMSNTIREKRVASAPSYQFDISDSSNKDPTDYSPAVMQWSEVIRKHLPLAICHCAPMVRAAAFNCFAGLTSSVFSMLNEDMQESIISSTVSAALNDKAPSIKSAACRAIGVLASFSQIVYNGCLLDKLIRAAELNCHDSTVSVRVTASWALANICDSLRHRAIELQLELCSDETAEFDALSLVVETALKLTKDGDKIKSNAVRALGHISRFLNFNCYSMSNEVLKISKESCHSAKNPDLPKNGFCKEKNSPVFRSNGSNSAKYGDPQLLEKMVQAFLSCVTTGNVKGAYCLQHSSIASS
ncbi:HEAT repeat-containing protein 6 isoform X2 [Phalaenopsis equestris]|uniref:HEAT repeat-containing protein 6 isoform X2 n=1 Tax=Phalaenopsis equestris TaxID=78828 RepID=UPI0009E3CC21|nr:HEAT repeat-containing protein 6 isoform X2 [Phalaenopsis equestris]